jgi:hypothetical protein
MRILGIDPGLQTISFGSGPVLAHLHVRCADMSLHRNPCLTNANGALPHAHPWH